MGDVGDDLLEGDLDLTTLGDLDAEEEDALLADEEYDAYNNTEQAVYDSSTQEADSHTEIFHVIDHVQDVTEGDEIIDDGEDVLELAVVDELDESEVDNSQINNQSWTETSPKMIEVEDNEVEIAVGVTSSTMSADTLGGESDEEESEDRGSRFKTERTQVISLKSVSNGKYLKDIPDSLDKVQTVAPTTSTRPRGNLQRGGRGNIRGRLGPMPRGGMGMRGPFGPMGPMRPMRPMRPPHMMPPPHMMHQMHGSKIHVNPHFRDGVEQGPNVWNNARLPPPPGCDGFPPPPPNAQMDGGWGPPQQLPGPQYHPQHPGPPAQYQPPHPGPPAQYNNAQGYPPHQPQDYREPQQPMNAQQNEPVRRVTFSENSQLVTVENQHFHPPEQSYDTGYNNQYQPPASEPQPYNNYPGPSPEFHQQTFPSSNPPPSYPQPRYDAPPNAPDYQNYDPNSWSAPGPVESQQGGYYPPNQPQPMGPPVYQHQPAPQPQFQPPFPNQDPNFGSPTQHQLPPNARMSVKKRLAPRPLSNPSATPVKQMRFEHKPKIATTITRSNLQEIKTVDNLPDTTSKELEPEPEPEPETEEDEETKQYRLKIAEQKALREKLLKEKEARRLASIIQKQRQQEKSEPSVTSPADSSQSQQQPKPQVQQPRPQVQQQRPRMQMQQPGMRMQQPRMRMQQPRMRMDQPGMPMQRPGMPMQRPGMPMQRPGMPMQRPGMPMHRPGMPMQRPGMPMQRPGMPMQRPGMPMLRPGMPMQRPGMPMQQPGMPMQRPGMPMHRPGMPMQRPGMPMQRPGMPMQRPGMPMQQPGMQMQHPGMRIERPGQRMQQPGMRMQQPGIRMQQQQQRGQVSVRGRGRGKTVIQLGNKTAAQQKQNKVQSSNPGEQVQLQDILGTTYKIVKVRTKEGAIVTKKTPMVKNEANNTLAPMKTLNTSGPVQRRIVINNIPQSPVRVVNNSPKGDAQSNVRMVSAKQVLGRTLCTVQMNASSNVPKRVVIDNQVANTLVATAAIPVSTLVTVENLSLSTSKKQLLLLAKKVGNVCSFKHEPELRRATLKFKQPQEAARFFKNFHRKMIDLSRITVSVIPE